MSWIAPIGIPTPYWGGVIGNPIDTPRPTPPSPWTTNVPNVYYVETGGTNPSYGYPGNPCGEIPRILPAGTVVFLNGTYTKVHTPAYLHPDGNPDAPVWITSYDPEHPAKCTGDWTFLYDETYHCKYLIVDGVNWDMSAGGSAINIVGGSYICIRNGSVRGAAPSDPGDPNYGSSEPQFNQNTIGIGTYSGSLETNPTEQLVISGLNISYAGNWEYADGDPDGQGVAVSPTTQDVWVVDCTISYCSGCAVMFGTGTTGSLLDSLAGRRMYLGRCEAHHIAQSAFWTKRSVDCVMSQNVAHGMRRDTPSSPNAGGFGCQYGPINLWMIYNTVYDCQHGMYVAADASANGSTITNSDVWIVGNLIYDIHDEASGIHAGGADLTNFRGGADGGGTCIGIRGALNAHIINNTFHNYDRGIYCTQGSYNRLIEGNIFSGRDGTVDSADVYMDYDVGGQNTIKNNIIEEIAGTCWVKNGAATYTTVSAINAVGGNLAGNVSTAPTYVNAATNNYRLAEGSAGIDAFGTTANSVYGDFLTAYGRSIQFDLSGGTRPWDAVGATTSGASWDIGAYEFGASAPPVIAPPTFSSGNHITFPN